MTNTFIATILISLNSLVGLAQNPQTITALHQRLSMSKDDNSRIHTQIDLCSTYRLGNTDSSLYYGRQAIKLAQEIDYPTGEILALSFMSITLEQLGNLPMSLEMSFKALQIAKLNNLENVTSPALNAIGEVYIILMDYPKALSFLEKQRKLYENGNVDDGLGYALYDIGIVYEEMNQLDSAMSYEMKALDLFKRLHREEPLVFKVLGNIELKSGNFSKALSYYQQGLQIAIQNNERRASAILYNKIASFYKITNRPDSGIYYAQKGLKESELISHKKAILDAATLLSEFYERKNAGEAYRYLKIANIYKDSLFGTGNIQAIHALVDNEEEYQKEIDAAKIKYQNQLKQHTLIFGLGIILLVAVILYRNNRQKQNANNELTQTLLNLKSTQSQLLQSEKMASLGELTAGIAHEIQNPLNFVNNFSEVNKELADELEQEIEKGNTADAKALAKDIKENQDKILHHGKRADAIVKGMLQHSRTSSSQKESTDINALCDEYLRLSYHGLRAKDKSFNATIETGFDASVGKINIVPQDIGRVILNLINNAFYAVSEKKKQQFNYVPTGHAGYEPAVTVSTRQAGNNILISVKDNGNGIPQEILDKIFQPFFTTKPTGQGTGLGLSLSYDIVKAHGGEIKLESKEGKGSEFIINLPILQV